MWRRGINIRIFSPRGKYRIPFGVILCQNNIIGREALHGHWKCMRPCLMNSTKKFVSIDDVVEYPMESHRHVFWNWFRALSLEARPFVSDRSASFPVPLDMLPSGIERPVTNLLSANTSWGCWTLLAELKRGMGYQLVELWTFAHKTQLSFVDVESNDGGHWEIDVALRYQI